MEWAKLIKRNKIPKINYTSSSSLLIYSKIIRPLFWPKCHTSWKSFSGYWYVPLKISLFSRETGKKISRNFHVKFGHFPQSFWSIYLATFTPKNFEDEANSPLFHQWGTSDSASIQRMHRDNRSCLCTGKDRFWNVSFEFCSHIVGYASIFVSNNSKELHRNGNFHHTCT